MTAARALERLYAVSPREFTRTRNTLAAELRKSRDLEAARAVAAVRRPAATLWAVNQLARHAQGPLTRFLDAVERLRRTQLSDPRGAMEAMRAERAHLETLVQRAEQALAEAGYSPSAEARRRIGDTLLGAAADRRHAEALAHGRLTEELQAPGFDALTGAGRLRLVQGGAGREGAERRAREDSRSRAPDARTARPREAQTRTQAAKARAREAKAEEREAKGRERAAQAEQRRREAETRRRAAAERAAEVAALEREAAAARERLADVQRRLKDARRGKGAPAR